MLLVKLLVQLSRASAYLACARAAKKRQKIAARRASHMAEIASSESLHGAPAILERKPSG
jgi:hypothetical protein